MSIDLIHDWPTPLRGRLKVETPLSDDDEVTLRENLVPNGNRNSVRTAAHTCCTNPSRLSHWCVLSGRSSWPLRHLRDTYFVTKVNISCETSKITSSNGCATALHVNSTHLIRHCYLGLRPVADSGAYEC